MSFREICVQCGKEKAIYLHLCQNCYSSQNPMIIEKKDLEIQICSFCFSILIGNRWTSPHKSWRTDLFLKTLNEIIGITIMKEWIFQYALQANITSNKLIPETDKPNYAKGTCTLIGRPDTFSPINIEETHQYLVIIKWKSCDKCQAIRTETYNAKIQVRGLNDAEYDNIYYQIADIVENLETKVTDAFVSKVTEVRGGFDIFLGSKKLALEVSKFFKDHYSATITQTAESTGGYDLQRSQFRYRTVISVRLPIFREGDVIELQSMLYQVQKFLSNGRIRLYHLKNNRRIIIDYSQLSKASVNLYLCQKDLESFQILSFEKNDVVLVQRMSNFETNYCRLALKEINEGDILSGVITRNGDIFLLPNGN